MNDYFKKNGFCIGLSMFSFFCEGFLFITGLFDGYTHDFVKPSNKPVMNKNPSQKNENMLNPIHKPLIAISTGCLKKLAKNPTAITINGSHCHKKRKRSSVPILPL